jgi:nucleoid-associated protein YgaU
MPDRSARQRLRRHGAANSIKRMQSARNDRQCGLPMDPPAARVLRAGAAGRVRPGWPAPERLATVVVAAAAAAALLWAWAEAVCRPALAALLAPGPASPSEGVTAALAVAALLCGAWLTLTAALEVVAALPGRAGVLAGRWSANVGAPLVRRGVTLLLGAGLAAGAGSPLAVAGAGPGGWPDPGFRQTSSAPSPGATAGPGAGAAPALPQATASSASPASASAPAAAPASAAAPAPAAAAVPSASPTVVTTSPTTSPTTPATTVPTRSRPDGPPGPGWTPTAPTVRPQPSTALLHRSRGSRPDGEVVVLRGDTLWGIAARHLGAGATDAEVAREWPRWYAANETVIGADPDLLRPGQRLTPPESTGRTSGADR